MHEIAINKTFTREIPNYNLVICAFILSGHKICFFSIHGVDPQIFFLIFKNSYCGPGQWLSWLGFCPTHQMVLGSIPGVGTYLGCILIPGQGRNRRQLIHVSPSHLCLSVSLSLPPSHLPSLFLSLKGQ